MGSRKTVPPLRCILDYSNKKIEHRDLQGISDGAVGGQPHLLQLELLHSCLVRGNGRTLDTNRVFLDGLGSINGDLVVGLIAVGQAKIVVLEVNIQVASRMLDSDLYEVIASFNIRVDELKRFKSATVSQGTVI